MRIPSTLSPPYPTGVVSPPGEFIEWLLSQGRLAPVAVFERGEGDLIVYCDRGEVRHSGIVSIPGRVRSKWGKGHVWEHGVWETPAELRR